MAQSPESGPGAPLGYDGRHRAMRLFLFGLLRDENMRAVVLGRPTPRRLLRRARLRGVRLATLRKETYPVLVPALGAWVPGDVVEGLTSADIERISFFESVEYALTSVTVELIGGDILAAQAFAAAERSGVEEEEWRFTDWRRRHKARDLHVARLWMALYGRSDATKADRLWDEAIAAGRTIEDLVEEIRREPLGTRS